MTTPLPEHSSNPEEEMPRVLVALHAVFQPGNNTNPNATNSQEADRYLTSFQRTTVAWQVCDRLLTTNAQGEFLDTQVHFFAAQTLHAKCRTDVLQLKETDFPSLRDSLMAHLLRFCSNQATTTSSGSGPIVTRLAMALCALAVQMKWTTVLTDLLSNFASANDGSAGGGGEEGKIHLALEICQLLPEETTSNRLLPRNGENQRACFLTVLRQSSVQVLDFLWFCASSSFQQQQQQKTLKIKELALRCFHSWIRYVDTPPSALKASPLVDWAFQTVKKVGVEEQEGDMFELAVDVIVELLRCYPSDIQLNMELVQKMVPLLMTLSSTSTTGNTSNLNQKAESSAFHTVLAMKDEDGLRAFCRIFTEMGEAYMSLIMSYENLNQVALLDLVLACSAIPDHDISNITLHFWYRFVSSLECIEPYECRQYQIDNFAPQLATLVSTCTSTLLRYPTDMDSLPPDLLDEVYRHRSYVSDTIEDCCRLLGGNSVLTNIGQQLHSECQRLSSQSTTPGSPPPLLTQWHGIESCLFALISTARYAPLDESAVMPFVMSIIPDLVTTTTNNQPSTTPNTTVATPPLCDTINSLVGAFAPWFDRHSEHLIRILNIISTTMQDRRCASTASTAIKKIFESCRSSDCLSGETALRWYEEIVKNQQQQHNQTTFALELKDELEVLEGVCKALSRHSEAELTGFLGRIVQPIGMRLKSLSSVEGATPNQIAAELERMTVVVRFLDFPDANVKSNDNSTTPPPPARSQFLLNLATECWPLLESVSQKYPTDFNLAEKLCRLHKHLLRRCGPASYHSMIQPLCTYVVEGYKRSRLSPYLYMASICIAEFGSGGIEEKCPVVSRELLVACEPILLEMLKVLSEVSFGFLTSLEEFRSHPDVLEELFFMASRMVQCCPKPFVGSELLHAYIQCAVAGMALDHIDANRGMLNFLETTIGYGLTLREYSVDLRNQATAIATSSCMETLERAVMAEGKKIVTNLVEAMLGNLPCYRITASNKGSIAGILFKLHQLLNPGMLANWVREALEAEQQSVATALLGQDHTSAVKSELIDSLTNVSCPTRKDFFNSVSQFAAVCDRRRRMGTR